MKKVNSNYFTTIPGSNTLAILASFNIGREILLTYLKQTPFLSAYSATFEKMPKLKNLMNG